MLTRQNVTLASNKRRRPLITLIRSTRADENHHDNTATGFSTTLLSRNCDNYHRTVDTVEGRIGVEMSSPVDSPSLFHGNYCCCSGISESHSIQGTILPAER